MSYNPNLPAGQASAAASNPVTLPQESIVTTSITTQNLNGFSGAATAGSAAELILFGAPEVAIVVTGTYTGVLTIQAMVDGTNWASMGGSNLRSFSTGSFNTTIASASVGTWNLPTAGYQKIRVTGLATVTGTAVVTIRSSYAPSFAPSSIATVGQITSSVTPGTAAISLGKAKANTAGATDTGVAMLGLRADTLAIQAATGQYIIPALDLYGAMLIRGYEKQARTYSVSVSATPGATATDFLVLPGNASNTVYVTRIIITGTQTTAGFVAAYLILRSTANTGGTSATSVPIKHQQTDAAAISVPLLYSVNPTALGTAIGTIRSAVIPMGSATVPYPPYVIEFGDKGKPVVLSGVAQMLAINLNGSAVSAGLSLAVMVEYFEV